MEIISVIFIVALIIIFSLTPWLMEFLVARRKQKEAAAQKNCG